MSNVRKLHEMIKDNIHKDCIEESYLNFFSKVLSGALKQKIEESPMKK